MTTEKGNNSSVGAYYSHTRSEMLNLLPSSYSKVLEIGCGAGGFARQLSRSAEIWGVEPDEASAEVARQYIAKVLCGTYDAVADLLPDGYFDLVVCNDVIEHMNDHDRFLETIKKKLQKNGFLVGSVPNVRYYRNLFDLVLRADWRYREQGVLDRTHVRFFTKRSLKRSLEHAQFRVESLKGITSATGKVQDIADVLKVATLLPLALLSFGFLADIRFLQIAFRVRYD